MNRQQRRAFERKANKPATGDRNDKAVRRRKNIRKQQALREWLLYESQDPPTSEQDLQDQYDTTENYYRDLQNARNIPYAFSHFEHLIRRLKILHALIDGGETMLKHCENAQAALQAVNGNWDMPAEQRHAVLLPLCGLNEYIRTIGAALPADALDAVGNYSSAISCCSHYAALYRQPFHVIVALIAVIRGATLRSQAQKFRQPENTLKREMLHAAQHLFRIGLSRPECTGIAPAHTVTALRSRQWRFLGDFDRLADIAVFAQRQVAEPFEAAFGIGMYDWAAHNRQMVQTVKKLKQKPVH